MPDRLSPTTSKPHHVALPAAEEDVPEGDIMGDDGRAILALNHDGVLGRPLRAAKSDEPFSRGAAPCGAALPPRTRWGSIMTLKKPSESACTL